MIILFGDSWARQAHYHVSSSDTSGYQHWQFKHITVATNYNVWLHGFFQHNSALNLAEFGNDLDTILKNIGHFKNIATNLKEVNYLVFQTDPLRIFAPRMDYTDYDTVWPRFLNWSNTNNFDWKHQLLTDLVDTVYQRWYSNLKTIEIGEQQTGFLQNLYLVGGVSKVHDSVNAAGIKVLLPSATEFFGFDQDCPFENRASLTCFVDFWSRSLDHKQSYALKSQWYHYEEAMIEKEKFWIANPEFFAGRHLTAHGMEKLAGYLENLI